MPALSLTPPAMALAAYLPRLSSLFPSPSSSPTPSAAQETTHVENWFERHADQLISHGAEVLTIIIACVVLRMLLRRSIGRLVRHATWVAESRAGQLLSGSGLVAGERTRQRAQAIGSVLRSVATALVVVVGVLMLCSVLTVPIAPLLASVSVIGVAVGLGTQSLIGDFIAGIFMIFEDQYGVGDVIDTGQARGTVEEVGLRITKLRDVDGVAWYVRNGTISRVGNTSQGWSRAVVDVPVAYTEDVGKVRKLLTEAADGLYADEAWRDRFTDDKPKVMGIETLNGAYVVIRIQARTVPQKNIEVQRELWARLKSTLDAAEVQVASLT